MRTRCLTLLFAGLLLCPTLPANAELTQAGKLIVGFDGGLSPTKLPRTDPAPVSVRVAGDVRHASGDPDRLPQLRRISVGINRAGRLFDKGMPSCEVGKIQPATEAEAQARCARSIVGSGNVELQVRLPNQEPFMVRATLLAFNGPQHGGQKTILAQVYAEDPPGAFVLTFKVKRRGGVFGTVLSTTLPKSAQQWAYLTHFEMTLHRIYRYRGERHSYISAACAAPAGFPGAVFPFAKATYGFDNGQKLTTTAFRSCRVR